MHLNLIKTDGMFVVMLNRDVWKHVPDLSISTRDLNRLRCIVTHMEKYRCIITKLHLLNLF